MTGFNWLLAAISSKTSTLAVGGAVATQVGLSGTAHAAGSDVLKVGLIGCGGRGTGAAEQICIASQPDKNVKLYAMGDLFLDHLETARKRPHRRGGRSG